MVASYGAELRFGKRAAGVARAARGGTDGGSRMSETKRDYDVVRGKPPVHSRFKKGQSGNPRGPRPKSLPALLVDALNEKVVATIDGELRDHQARRGRHSAGQRSDRRRSARHQDAAPFTAADEEVMATFITRLRQSWEEELKQRGP